MGRTRTFDQAAVLTGAMMAFREHGFAGASIRDLERATGLSAGSLYNAFGDKEGLYISALENAYAQVRDGEAKLDVEGLPPIEALRKLVEFTFDHHRQHEEFIRMVMIENIHHGEFLERSGVIRDLNVTAIGSIEAIYAKGLADGLFRAGLDPLEIHWQISALCFFNVSNRATFSRLFARDFGAADMQERLKRNTVEMVLRYVARSEALTE